MKAIHDKAASTIHLQAPGFTSIRSHLLWNLSPDRTAHTSWNLQSLLSTRVFEIVKKKKILQNAVEATQCFLTFYFYSVFTILILHILNIVGGLPNAELAKTDGIHESYKSQIFEFRHSAKENTLACSADNKTCLPMMIHTQNFSSGGGCAVCRVVEVKNQSSL